MIKGGADVSTLSTISCVDRDGKVERLRRPEGLGENASVLVTFPPANEGIEPETAVRAADAEAAARGG